MKLPGRTATQPARGVRPAARCAGGRRHGLRRRAAPALQARAAVDRRAQTSVARAASCTSRAARRCHGLEARGHQHRPELIGVGAAAVDFQVSTGRMPLAAPGAPGPAQARRSSPTSRSPRSPPTSRPSAPVRRSRPPSSCDTTNADLALGGELFRTNCAQCHNFAGQGGALTQGKYAPSLMEATPQADLRGHAHRPAEHAGLRRRHAHARGQAGDHQVRRAPAGRSPSPGGCDLGSFGPVTEGVVPVRRRRCRRTGRGRRLDRSKVTMTDIATPRRAPSEPARPSHLPRAPRRAPPRAAPTSTPRARQGAERQVALMFLLSTLLHGRCSSSPTCASRRSTTIDAAAARRDRRAEPGARPVPRPGASCSSASARSTGPRSSCPTRGRRSERHDDALADDDDRRGRCRGFERGLAESGLRPASDHPPHADRARWRSFPLPLVVLLARPLAPRRSGRTVPPSSSRRRSGRTGMRIVTDVEHQPDPARGHPGRRPGQRACRRTSGGRGGEGNLNARAKAAIILVRMAPDEIRRPAGRGLGLPGDPRLLQDLHPRRLPDRAVRAAHAPPALPLPPVHVRPGRLPATSSSDRPRAACRSCRSPSTTRATWSPQATSTNRSDRASGSADERRRSRPSGKRRDRLATSTSVGNRHLARPAQPRTRSSPTTGRSCSARSRCTRSSSCCSPACS